MDKILIANFYPVYPFAHGGQRRIYFLARELARQYRVLLVTLSRGHDLKYLDLDDGLTEIQVPAEDRFLQLEREIARDNPMVTDIAYTMHWKQCRLYQAVLREQIRTSALTVSEHPYSVYAIRQANGRNRNVPMIYNSQNVEVAQKAPVLADRDDLLRIVKAVEHAAVTQSDAVVTCSESDRDSFLAEYAVPAHKITVIRNGVDSSAPLMLAVEKREAYRTELGLGGRFTAIFGGSFHFPNLSAVDCILAAAAKLPDVTFIILGSVCRYQALQQDIPENVLALGTIPEAEKWLAFAVSDLALNPMSLGSGSNIKMFEYAAAGLPALSTAFGARGTGMQPGIHYHEAEVDAFAPRLREIMNSGKNGLEQMGSAARSFVSETSDWRVIGAEYRKLVSAMLDKADERTRRLG